MGRRSSDKWNGILFTLHEAADGFFVFGPSIADALLQRRVDRLNVHSWRLLLFRFHRLGCGRWKRLGSEKRCRGAMMGYAIGALEIGRVHG